MTIKDSCKSLIDKQTEKGVNKYNTTLDDANLSALELIQHAQEEIVDLLQYLEGLKRKLQKQVAATIEPATNGNFFEPLECGCTPYRMCKKHMREYLEYE